MRLRRSHPHRPGYTRRRQGRGFGYRDQEGRVITDPAELERIRNLVIPPAWRDVWICPDPHGHIQAIGTDAAGRRQYLYHAEWRRRRDGDKFDHVLAVAARLPTLRARVRRDLNRPGLPRERVLAGAARLIDLGLFRVGNDQYAEGDDATFGVATLRADHVTATRDGLRFCFPAKGGVQRKVIIEDRQVRALVRSLLRQRHGADRLLAYRHEGAWREIHSADVNDYLRAAARCDITAKDFRTWHATVRAAIALAGADQRDTRSPTGRRRAVSAVMREVSAYLGNTPAVARASYVHPGVVDLFMRGITVRLPPRTRSMATVERAVLDLLSSA